MIELSSKISKCVSLASLALQFLYNLFWILVESFSLGERNGVAACNPYRSSLTSLVERLAALLSFNSGISEIVSGGVWNKTFSIIHFGSAVESAPVIETVLRSMLSDLLIPHFLDVIWNVWCSVGPRSVNWEFSVKSLGSFATFQSRFTLQGKIELWGLEATVVCHSVVKTEDTLNFLGFSNSLSDGVNLILKMVFVANSSGILVVNKSVALHRRMNLRRAHSWILRNSVIISLISVLEAGIGFVERHGGFSFIPSLFSFFLVGLNVIAGVDNWPSDSNVFWWQVWVGTILQALPIECVARPVIGLCCSSVPCLIGSCKLLLDNRHVIGSLRSVSIYEDVAHFLNKEVIK